MGNVATILLTVLQLVEFGMKFESIVNKVKEMEAEGATPEQVSVFLKGLRDKALAELGDALNKN